MIDTVVEPFAGLAAYSLRAMWSAAGSRGDVRGEPPVSRMGNKAGCVPNSFRAWGLNRVRWKAVWLNDASAVCHMFHLLYSSHELRVEVARRIWAMVPCPECLPMDTMWALKGELKPTPDYCSSQKEVKPSCPTCNGTGVHDARQLWERIRKEPIPGDVAQMVATGLFLQARNFRRSPIETDNDKWSVAGFQTETGICDRWGIIGTSTWARRDQVAGHVELLPCGMAQLADVTAKALFMQSRSFSLKPVEIVGGAWDERGYKAEHYEQKEGARGNPQGDDSPRHTVAGRVEALPGRWEEKGFNPEDRRSETKFGMDQPRHEVSRRLDSLPISHLSIRATWGDAALVLPDGDASNVLCVLDPPYVGTSGYSADCPRETVLGLARAWHDAGALVLLHEACGLAGELGQGWLERDASGLRGKVSTFWQKDKSKPNAKPKQREWLTFNREPVWWPNRQEVLYDMRIQAMEIKEAFKKPVMVGTPDLQGSLF